MLSLRASSRGVQLRGGWLVMMAVISWRWVGGRGPIRAEVLRCGRRLLVRAAALPGGGVRTVTVIVVMALTAWGRWSPWLR